MLSHGGVRCEFVTCADSQGTLQTSHQRLSVAQILLDSARQYLLDCTGHYNGFQSDHSELCHGRSGVRRTQHESDSTGIGQTLTDSAGVHWVVLEVRWILPLPTDLAEVCRTLSLRSPLYVHCRLPISTGGDRGLSSEISGNFSVHWI